MAVELTFKISSTFTKQSSSVFRVKLNDILLTILIYKWRKAKSHLSCISKERCHYFIITN